MPPFSGVSSRSRGSSPLITHHILQEEMDASAPAPTTPPPRHLRALHPGKSGKVLSVGLWHNKSLDVALDKSFADDIGDTGKEYLLFIKLRTSGIYLCYLSTHSPCQSMRQRSTPKVHQRDWLEWLATPFTIQ